jgi:hypothetical protein
MARRVHAVRDAEEGMIGAAAQDSLGVRRKREIQCTRLEENSRAMDALWRASEVLICLMESSHVSCFLVNSAASRDPKDTG